MKNLLCRVIWVGLGEFRESPRLLRAKCYVPPAIVATRLWPKKPTFFGVFALGLTHFNPRAWSAGPSGVAPFNAVFSRDFRLQKRRTADPSVVYRLLLKTASIALLIEACRLRSLSPQSSRLQRKRSTIQRQHFASRCQPIGYPQALVATNHFASDCPNQRSPSSSASTVASVRKSMSSCHGNKEIGLCR